MQALTPRLGEPRSIRRGKSSIGTVDALESVSYFFLYSTSPGLV